MRQMASMVYKLCFVLLLFGIFYSYAMFQGGFVSWFLFYSFLPILIYMFLLVTYPLSGWAVSRKLSRHTMQASEKVNVQIEIHRKIPFPVFYCIIEELLPVTLLRKDNKLENYKYMDQSKVLAEKRTVKKIFFPWFSRKIIYQYELDQVPRGEHHFQAVRVRIGDFLGLIKKEHVYPVPSHLLVYPARREVLIKDKVTSFEEGAAASFSLQERNMNVVTGVREYMPGDRFAWIDWKTTARRNTMMTKEFEQEKSSDLLLVLDAVNGTEGDAIAFEGSIELAASLIAALKKKSSQLALMSLGAEKTFFPFQQDPGKKGLLIDYLAKLQPGGKVPFSLQLSREIQKMPKDLITMLITTSLSREMQKPLTQLNKKSRKVVLFLVKPSSKITEEDNRMIHQLSVEGILVNMMTEEHFIRQYFEVNG